MSANGRWFFAVDRNGAAEARSTRGSQAASFKVLKPPIRAAAISPDGRWLALSVERDYNPRLYAVPGGEERQLSGHKDHVSGIAFSPNSKFVVTGSVDARVRIFEAATGRLVSELSGQLEEASDVAFSPDGRTAASVGSKSAVKLWHVATGRQVVSLPTPEAGLCLRFSPDGRRLGVSRQDGVLQFLEAPWP
jgi:WD40 repeat protein